MYLKKYHRIWHFKSRRRLWWFPEIRKMIRMWLGLASAPGLINGPLSRSVLRCHQGCGIFCLGNKGVPGNWHEEGGSQVNPSCQGNSGEEKGEFDTCGVGQKWPKELGLPNVLTHWAAPQDEPGASSYVMIVKIELDMSKTYILFL